MEYGGLYDQGPFRIEVAIACGNLYFMLLYVCRDVRSMCIRGGDALSAGETK